MYKRLWVDHVSISVVNYVYREDVGGGGCPLTPQLSRMLTLMCRVLTMPICTETLWPDDDLGSTNKLETRTKYKLFTRLGTIIS